MNFSKPVGLIQRQERLHVHIIERPSRCHNLRCQGGVEWLGAKYPALQELSLELVCKPGDKSTDLVLDKSMALSKSLNSRALFVALHLCRLFVYVRSTKPGQPAVATPPNTGTTLDMIQSFATSCGLYKENEMEASAVRLMPVLESTSRRPTLNENFLEPEPLHHAHDRRSEKEARPSWKASCRGSGQGVFGAGCQLKHRLYINISFSISKRNPPAWLDAKDRVFERHF